ncbi:TetR/AcrR family transcriptional regulator [Pseudopelagicola sp. nBUS_19]|uniref:TetR/AcrR family transcriptional regulator n=1 Tax=Pseudopelagicola sp. nBUS_19 TaxID=3395316 RepID=UPI003EBF34FB
MSSTRLSPNLWITAGFAALLEQGPTALKAESLARKLNTTKGSFYWHFKDVPDFHRSMLEQWERWALTEISEVLDSNSEVVQKIRCLSQIMTGKSSKDANISKLEPAIRAWSHDDCAVAEAVARVDELRMSQLFSVLSEKGLSNPELSRIIYAANIGMAELSRHDGAVNEEALGTLVDLILALYK